MSDLHAAPARIDSPAPTEPPGPSPPSPPPALWGIDPVAGFECFRDLVCEALRVVAEAHRLALSAAPDERMGDVCRGLFGELAEAIGRAQDYWFDSTIARYLERPEGPVYLDSRGVGSATGTCYHDLALGGAVGLLGAMKRGGTAGGYVRAMRFDTGAGDQVRRHLDALATRVRCECSQGVGRFEKREQPGDGSTRADQGTPKNNKAKGVPSKPKRSTGKGEGRVKLIAALTHHHKYADGGSLNLDPVINNKLARTAGVEKSTASAFFAKEFGSHSSYRTICRDSSKLWASLKALNGEFSPHELFGRAPAGEDDRNDRDERRRRDE